MQNAWALLFRYIYKVVNGKQNSDKEGLYMKRTVKKTKNGKIVKTIVYEKDDPKSKTLKELFRSIFGSSDEIIRMPKKEASQQE